MALNVTCGNATIPSLSGDKRTHRDHRQSVARDPKATTASFDMCLRSSRVSDIRGLSRSGIRSYMEKDQKLHGDRLSIAF